MESQTTIQLLKLIFFTLLSLTLALHAILSFTSSSSNLIDQKLVIILSNNKLIVFSFLWCTLVSILAYISTRPLPVLLLNYTCFKPDHDRRCTLELCEYVGLRSRRYSEESADFMRAIYRKSGLGDETYAPLFLFQTDYEAKFHYAILEAEEGMFSSASSVLSKSGVSPSEITVLIVACSMFAPSPSLSSFVVNHLKLPSNVKTFNLSGMGCSAGTMAMDLAGSILRHRIGYALLVITESTSLNWYFGDNRHMLVTNCIFRAGTAAALMTSDPSRRWSAKMELIRTLRTHHGADDAAYNAAIQREDENGNIGVALTKDLVRVAGAGLKGHITTLAPRVLPVSELLKFAYLVVKSMFRGDKKTQHVPDFTTAFEHMCIHAGGKAVIDSVARLMKFSDKVVEPARMCLHRFGNTSSSLVLYEFAYFEAKGRIKAGDRVWMLAFGTGFKACSVVWRALQDSWMDADNPWRDCIHRYPV
ncbi:3-ketoacyl-CoA synthase 2-like [Dioscorea cayenensis subsp. rotundata]|uniref:3-ketoacyl-CoA synthase n=1 Tax=Dioscorea cayennensis subsp. rotundata TaxID=55577 RepID=A0AB40AQC4_DIOCR|nr:3-ketoacyl-CoA synthase 2-like [Dioscorea cayenensis subsp. rotundata]